MKYVVCIPDGCADEPCDELGGRTPLELASMPVLAGLAARAVVGRAQVIPEGFPPGSDVGNMSLLGYDPSNYHTGRAPIEAAALGISLNGDQMAFRANLVTVGDDGEMVDFAGGHPADDIAAAMISAVDAELGRGAGTGLEFHPGVAYRHVMVAPAGMGDAHCVPPHDLTGKAAVGPDGPSAAELAEVMAESRRIISSFGEQANQLWLWGQGTQPELTPFSEIWGLDAALVTAVDLVRGLGVLAGIAVCEAEGATGWFDTNYEAKRDVALDQLESGRDLAVIHVEATDEAGHAGNANEKIRALENWDSRILAELVPALDALGPWRMLIAPDHATPLRLRTHTADPVPYLIVDSHVEGPGGTYTESGVADSPIVAGHELMGALLRS